MRINTLEACAHTFFDEIRQHGAKMPSGRDFPPLFNFTSQGMCIHVCVYMYMYVSLYICVLLCLCIRCLIDIIIILICFEAWAKFAQ